MSTIFHPSVRRNIETMANNKKSLEYWNPTHWNLLIDGKPLFCKSWFDKSILHAATFSIKTQTHSSLLEDFCSKFDLKTPFTLYLGPINAIPSSWRLKNSPSRCSVSEENVEKSPQKLRRAFCRVLKRTFVPPTAENKIFSLVFLTTAFIKCTNYLFKLKMTSK